VFIIRLISLDRLSSNYKHLRRNTVRYARQLFTQEELNAITKNIVLLVYNELKNMIFYLSIRKTYLLKINLFFKYKPKKSRYGG
jgi:hypothetical protein